MIDVFAALAVLGEAIGEESAPQLISDAALFWSFYTQVESGKINLKDPATIEALEKSGKLKQLLDAGKRITDTADAIYAKPAGAINICKLIVSVLPS